MKQFPHLHPRDQIISIMERIYSHDMTTTSGGNVSIRDTDGTIWMTPARVDKGRLRSTDIVCLRPDGSTEGLHPPSSEAPFHLAIYQDRPDIHAVIHAHPGALVSFSIADSIPDMRIFPEAFRLCGKVGFAPYALPGSEQLGLNIAAEFASEAAPHCVLLENHGVVVGGPDLATTFAAFETLEFTALTLINASRLGPVNFLEESQLAAFAEGRVPLPQAQPLPASSREKELRKEMCDFIHRAYAHRLMTSTWGSYSARIDADSFLITPAHIDRASIELEDLIVIRHGKVDAGSCPSRATRIHEAIYAANPGVQSIVNALPVHATAFSVSEQKLDTRTIPESFLFLKDVPKIAFSEQTGDLRSLASQVSLNSPVALLDHNGAIVAGKSVLDAFDRLEVLESTAAAIIRSTPLGGVRSMPDAAIDALLKAFPAV